ncbi:hypothetical protein ORI89_11850 [Sphingobacterium sp. UT-1RO-CII-1]|uniref:hypothetical protein n=1 Tax=Sphingobacterium sp. UT-1RO-CII-1 TaxID=2995225 RepID=UPI00227AE98E|nr:hypothetical protein [Sphingobacterium sp. UT-1RO-CII-1]MCY4780347.1 hypothetical protein [Sphingobacterium sp. UT-1RO-CII-1]
MKKLIKLVPAMALLLALGVYTVNAKMKAAVAEKTQTEKEWMLKPGGNLTDPTDYEQASAGRFEDCVATNTSVCAIKAPADPNNPNIPLFSDQIQTALESDLNHPDISTGPYNP